ncbi:MAG TPA: TauD/TfdA family dioxygenase [Candidatus Methylomirabilis sp.]|nr:TauD/TfdA family dioxygenase [Candidatus Methylomirabilis sp.]
MQPNVAPIDATLGAVVTGLALARMDDSTWKAVEAAFHEHAVLVFPGQDLTEEEQVAFARRFGDIELLAPDPEQKAVAISNRKPDGTVMGPDEHRYKSLRGNEGWHTDSSYMPLAAKASVLSAQVVPSAGGETEWADMRAAYDALDEATRRRLAGLSAHHSLYHSQAQIGHVVQSGAGYGFHTKGAPLRPLVKIHAVTGRPALFIGRHAYGIPGLSEAESEQLLSHLVDFACRPPRTYAHRWRPGDVVIWDNRCVLHRARPYDYREVRVMRHTRVAGDPATELALTDRDDRAAAYEPSASNR